MSDARTTRWQFTAFEDQWTLIDNAVAELVSGNEQPFRMIKYQTEECPDTGKKHYQGCIQTIRQMRFAAIRKLLPGIHIEKARNWQALLQYCQKTDSKVSGGKEVSVETSYRPRKIHEVLIELAQIHLDMEDLRQYDKEGNKEETVRQPDNGYWEVAQVYLYRHPEMAGLIGQPMPQNLWKNARSVWIDLAKAN